MLKYFMSQQNNCAFLKLMSHMSTVPFFGTSFSFYAPFLILVICSITFYNIYPRLLSMLGFDHEDMIYLRDPEPLNSQVNEGILLLRRTRRNGVSSSLSDHRNSTTTRKKHSVGDKNGRSSTIARSSSSLSNSS